jgi:hypothetical protein
MKKNEVQFSKQPNIEGWNWKKKLNKKEED